MRPIIKAALFFIFPAAIAPAMAQYKCPVNGKTVFQDEPCREGRRYSDSLPVQAAKKDSPEAALPGGPIDKGKLLCHDMAPKMIAWKDAESLRIGDVFGGQMAVVEANGIKVGARQFFVPINGKNSYGAYIGYKPLICNTSEDGTRIINISDILLSAKP